MNNGESGKTWNEKVEREVGVRKWPINNSKTEGTKVSGIYPNGKQK
jgi:hypothetical protein